MAVMASTKLSFLPLSSETTKPKVLPSVRNVLSVRTSLKNQTASAKSKSNLLSCASYGSPLHGSPLYGSFMYGYSLYGSSLYGYPLPALFFSKSDFAISKEKKENKEKKCGGGNEVISMADSSKEKTPPSAEASPLVKLAWYGSEAFGKAVAVFKGNKGEKEGKEEEEEDAEGFGAVIEREAAMAALRKDYDRSYFVTGNMSMGIYEDDCEFADPFVSFRGRKRFKQNVSNLGSFMEDVNLKILDWQEGEDKVTTKWRFSCVLGLPWRPILAASGGTDHFFSKESGKIYKHVERWDISPADGVRQLFKPNPKFKKGN